MNDIIDSRSGRMEIDIYSAIMTTKYNIKSTGKSAAIKYNRKDILRDPVDLTLSYCMRTSSSRYKKCLKSKRDKMLLKKKNISLKKVFTKLSKKGNCTQAGYYLFLSTYFKVRILTRIFVKNTV